MFKPGGKADISTILTLQQWTWMSVHSKYSNSHLWTWFRAA
jgi:hypothetical protein